MLRFLCTFKEFSESVKSFSSCASRVASWCEATQTCGDSPQPVFFQSHWQFNPYSIIRNKHKHQKQWRPHNQQHHPIHHCNCFALPCFPSVHHTPPFHSAWSFHPFRPFHCTNPRTPRPRWATAPRSLHWRSSWARGLAPNAGTNFRGWTSRPRREHVGSCKVFDQQMVEVCLTFRNAMTYILRLSFVQLAWSNIFFVQAVGTGWRSNLWAPIGPTCSLLLHLSWHLKEQPHVQMIPICSLLLWTVYCSGMFWIFNVFLSQEASPTARHGKAGTVRI